MSFESMMLNILKKTVRITFVALWVSTVAGILAFQVKNSSSASSSSPHWSYGGHGNPTRWGELSPDFALCDTGSNQSPVDIKNTSPGRTRQIDFNYQSSPLVVANNGHTIQVNYAEGSSVRIDGKEYQLLQFHFHTPSEHYIEGNAYGMELHLVHQNQEKQLAVIGVMIQEGANNPVFDSIWANIPPEKGENQVNEISINARDLLPENLVSYSYNGSLTTPPCSEGVSWTVLTTPIEASPQQMEQFMEIYQVNARPVQPIGDRTIELRQ